MSSFILNAISEYGYFGMFLAMILEAVIIVIPSELILATGGILASKNIFSFFGALLTGIIGSVFLCDYYIPHGLFWWTTIH